MESKKSNKGSKKIDPCVEFARSGLTKREFQRRKESENAGPSSQNRGRTETKQARTSKDNRSKSCKSQKSTKSVKSSKNQNSNKPVKSNKSQNKRNTRNSEKSSGHNRGRSTTRQVNKLKDDRSNSKNSKKRENNANSLNNSKSIIKNLEAKSTPSVFNSSSADFEIEKNNSSQTKTHNTFLDLEKVEPSTSTSSQFKTKSSTLMELKKPTYIPISKDLNNENKKSKLSSTFLNSFKVKSSRSVKVVHQSCSKNQNSLTADNVVPLKDSSSQTRKSNNFIQLFKVKSSNSVKRHENISEQNKICSNGQLNKTSQSSLSNSKIVSSKRKFDALQKQQAQQDALSYEKIGNKVSGVSRSELSVKQHQNKQKKKREDESSAYDMWNIFTRPATSSKSEINNNSIKKQNKKMIKTEKSVDDNTILNYVPTSKVEEDSSNVKFERKPSKQSGMSEASKYYTAVQCPTNLFIKLKNCMSDLSSVKCNPNRKCKEKSKTKEKEDDKNECPFVFTLGP